MNMILKLCQNVYGNYTFLIGSQILWCPFPQEGKLNFCSLRMGWTWWLTSNKQNITKVMGCPSQDSVLWLPSSVFSLSLSLSLLLSSLTLEAMARAHHVERPTWWWIEASSSSPVFRVCSPANRVWLQSHERPWARTTHLTYSQIPNPLKHMK